MDSMAQKNMHFWTFDRVIDKILPVNQVNNSF